MAVSPVCDVDVDLVVKIGGAQGIAHGEIARDIARLVGEGLKVVVVHGGSHEATLLAQRLGKTPQFITSPSGHVSRRTNRETLEILMMACAGKVNKSLVECLQGVGVNAVGVTGIDGRLLAGSRKKAVKSVEGGKVRILRDDFGGKVESVNTVLLSLLMRNGYTPVVGPLAISDEGEALNVDADRVASIIACALHSARLVILSNVPGLLRDPLDASSLVRNIPRASIPDYARYASGRMKKKMLAAAEAVEGGVLEVILGDARVPEPLRRAMDGEGTVIR